MAHEPAIFTQRRVDPRLTKEELTSMVHGVSEPYAELYGIMRQKFNDVFHKCPDVKPGALALVFSSQKRGLVPEVQTALETWLQRTWPKIHEAWKIDRDGMVAFLREMKG